MVLVWSDVYNHRDTLLINEMKLMRNLCLATMYTGNFTRLGDLCAATLSLYAKRYACSFRVILSDDREMTRPAAWHKIELIHQLFEEGFEFVFWIDADALFLRYDDDIQCLIRPDKDIYMVRHCIPEHYGEDLIPNCGILLVRNCPWTQKFLSQIWDCTQYLNHVWWENAAMLHLLGLNRLIGEGEDRPNEDMLEHFSFIETEWNSLPRLCPARNPIINHYAGMEFETRLSGMSQDFMCSLEVANEDGLLDEEWRELLSAYRSMLLPNAAQPSQSPTGG